MLQMSKDLSLDQEGIPDLDGPLSAKSETGDPQEGVSPPSDRPASLDWGTTAIEQSEDEPLSARLARERPDDLVAAVDLDYPVELVDGGVDVDDGELIGQAVETDAGMSAEEAAIHIVTEP